MKSQMYDFVLEYNFAVFLWKIIQGNKMWRLNSIDFLGDNDMKLMLGLGAENAKHYLVPEILEVKGSNPPAHAKFVSNEETMIMDQWDS